MPWIWRLSVWANAARELNYISDVDVVYVIAPVPASELPEGVEPLTEQDCAQIGTELVHALTKAIMAPAAEPPLWEVDANLRPEGKDGPLVRTVESYVRYYKRWAENWEFQALLKARPIAGSAHLGEKYARESNRLCGNQPLGIPLWNLCRLCAPA